jgi:hypothetical protein
VYVYVRVHIELADLSRFCEIACMYMHVCQCSLYLCNDSVRAAKRQCYDSSCQCNSSVCVCEPSSASVDASFPIVRASQERTVYMGKHTARKEPSGHLRVHVAHEECQQLLRADRQAERYKQTGRESTIQCPSCPKYTPWDRRGRKQGSTRPAKSKDFAMALDRVESNHES